MNQHLNLAFRRCKSGIKSAPDVAHNHVMSAIILVSQKTSEVMENLVFLDKCRFFVKLQ